MGIYAMGYSITAMAAIFVLLFLALLFVVFWSVMKMGPKATRMDEEMKRRAEDEERLQKTQQYWFDADELFKHH
jgi:lipopolysaccharide export LptBFGC system permease protein LptF